MFIEGRNPMLMEEHDMENIEEKGWSIIFAISLNTKGGTLENKCNNILIVMVGALAHSMIGLHPQFPKHGGKQLLE
jgi:hypothetical protein